jgi:hypothetical protein
MRIYLAHSTSFDYKKELYEPIRKSKLNKVHEIIMPHENSDDLFNSKDFLKKDSKNIIVAEISYPSIGLGIELGWANALGNKIICIHKKEAKLSNSVKAVTKNIIVYEKVDDLIEKLNETLKYI